MSSTHEEEAIGEEDGQEELEANCTISMSAGTTIPTGPYANVRFDVGATLAIQVSDMEEGYSYLKNWVDEKLNELSASAGTVKGNDKIPDDEIPF